MSISRHRIITIKLQRGVVSKLISGALRVVPLADVHRVKSIVLISSSAILSSRIGISPCDALIGYRIVARAKRPLNQIQNFGFSIAGNHLRAVIVTSFNLPRVPSRIVDACRLSVRRIIDDNPSHLVIFRNTRRGVIRLDINLLRHLNVNDTP